MMTQISYSYDERAGLAGCVEGIVRLSATEMAAALRRVEAHATPATSRQVTNAACRAARYSWAVRRWRRSWKWL